MLQILDVRRRGNHGRDLRASFHRLAELQELDPVARFGERLKIGDDFVPIEQFVIDADLVAEVALRSRNRGPGGNQKQKTDGNQFHRGRLHSGNRSGL